MRNPPSAANSDNAYFSHRNRRNYVRKAYPLIKEENGLDLWYGKKALYGRIDHKQNPVLISEVNFPLESTGLLIGIPCDSQTI